MTTETTTTAPIDLPEITDEMVERATNAYLGASHYADPDMRAVLTEFRAELLAGAARWQPIERDQIRAGMRIRATTTFDDFALSRTGVVHHTHPYGEWFTELNWLLTGWADPITYEVDPTIIPADSDADLIEAIGKAIHDADKRYDEWGEDPSADAYRRLARAALAAIRESEATA